MVSVSEGTHLRSEIDESFFLARNCEASHGMVEPKLFFCSVQQIKKQRVLQIRYGHHEPLLFDISHVNCNVTLWNIVRFQRGVFCINQKRQTNTHGSKVGWSLEN
ncbi:hypothetical protein V8G54_022765, partial [Vigna mungo]